MPMTVKCPVCRAEVAWEGNPFRPFCSERCKTLDLGAWLTEAYKGSFNTIANQQGVDGVIKTLQDRNRQLANAKS